MPDNLVLEFNGNAQIVEKHYTDRKSHGSWNYPYGMLVYDVTNDFDANGNYATLTNANWNQKTVSMRGMLLVVIYEDANEPRRQIYVNEEFDVLYGGSGRCTTPEEATAYAPFGAIDLCGVKKATLITVAPGADGPEGDLSFNDQIWTDVWSFTTAAQIGIDERDVTLHLSATDNEANFRSDGDYMEASNAFLIVEKLISASVTFDKKKLNLNSNGILKAFITLPDGCDVTDIDVSTVKCENASVFVGGGVIPGRDAFEAKFKIQNLTVSTGEEVELTVKGELFNGTPFEGSNTLKVV